MIRSRQELFDIMATHLMTQGTRSVNPDSAVCLYRGPNGTKCAVGVLIPDDEYDEDMENEKAGAVAAHFIKDSDLRQEFQNNFALMQDMQQLHDRTDVVMWRVKLSVIATDHQLNTNSTPTL